MTNRDKFGMAVELMQGTEVDPGILYVYTSILAAQVGCCI
jgi:hypothetical protein